MAVFAASGARFLDCVGEVVHVQTVIPFAFNRVTTPSGNTVLSDHFIQGAGSGTAVGLTSGTVWTLDRAVSPEVIRVNAGEMSMFTANIWWVSETGSSFNVHTTFHFVQNANGDVTVDRFETRCKAH